MNWIDLFIQRPVLTWMLTLSLIVFGILGLNRLGVDQYPKMEFPMVMVSAAYEGATPEVMEEDITEPLEEQLNTIEGVKRVQSRSREGSSTISVEFELGTDLDTATQDVRDRVELARFELPDDVESPVVSKRDFSGFPIMWIPLMTDRPQVEASEFVKRIIKPKVETVSGVAGIEVFGELDRSIRIWLDGDAMRARGLAATDVIATLRREHIERPGGIVEGGWVEFSVRTEAEYETVEQLADMVVAYEDGAPVRLRDVSRVEDGSADQRFYSRFDGQSAVGLGVIKTSDGNTVAVADGVLSRIAKLQHTLPQDMHFKQGDGVADFSRSIREAIEEAIFSLWFGALLATLTVFVFLRRFRPTLVVALAIPFSLITTFGVMWLFDYTLNTMTILALTLAVGVVIDDAIVVLENIERHRERGETPYDAASKGTKEIAFAATAATVSIAVVFLPVIFVNGMVGNFLGEFGATVASAVMVSLIVALTLTPMLAARIPAPKERAHGSIYGLFDRMLDGLERRYKAALGWTIHHRVWTLGLAVVSLVASLVMARSLGAEFFPSADQGRFFVGLETPPGTSPASTLEHLIRIENWVNSQPEVAGSFSGAGSGGSSSGEDPTRGIMFVMLKNRAERTRSSHEIIEAAREALGNIPGQKVRFSDMSGFGSSSDSAKFEVQFQGNVELETLDRLATQLIAELERNPDFTDLDKGLKLGSPEIRVIPDREKAAALGVDADQLATTVQAMIGGMDVGTFKEAGNRYDIRVRLDQQDRGDPESLLGLYVRTRSGDVVELRNLVSLKAGAAPSMITRVDRQRSVRVSGNLADDLKLGEALEIARGIAAGILPDDVRLAASGASEEFEESFSELAFAMLLAVLVIYMILAAQFESLVHPLTVMMALPLAMVGAFLGLFLKGMTLNIFSLIGIILLFGLVTKNSILLVDYANQLRSEGMDKVTAMTTAAPIRMRPVLMTALSMIFGVAPAALGIGPGAESRAPMAVATGAGMISSTVLTLLIVPAFYLALDDFVEWVKAKIRRGDSLPEDEAVQTAQA